MGKVQHVVSAQAAHKLSHAGAVPERSHCLAVYTALQQHSLIT